MKRCGHCKINLPKDKFNRKGNGLQPLCKECNKKRSKTYYINNRKTHTKKTTERNTKQRKILQEYIKNVKESSPCTDCKNFYPYYVMDFDHIRDKKEIISRLVGQAASINTVIKEIDKCELVCANCHRYRTFKNKK